MALRRDAKVELLRRAPLFARCSKRDLAEIARVADEIDLSAGKALTREGERGREFVILLAGTAEVRRNGRKLNSLGPGDFLGEIALFSRSPRTATVTTTSPVRLLVLTDRAFDTLLGRYPGILGKVLAAMAERLAPATL